MTRLRSGRADQYSTIMNLSDATSRVCDHCGKTNRVPLRHLADVGRCGACKTELPPAARPVDLDAASFDAVINSRVPVLVDFWASWCGPCRVMAPELEKVAESHAGKVLIGKVDTDRFPELARRYAIEALPTLVVFRQGQAGERLAGARPAAAIVRDLAL